MEKIQIFIIMHNSLEFILNSVLPGNVWKS